MKKSILLSTILSCGWMVTNSQNIVSPPTNSSSVAKMVDHPVNLSTGVPQISIPLYTVQGRKLSFPISLSYNASGIKVSEVAGSVGLGWTLNAEALITRAVRGRPDEWPGSFFSYASAIPNYSPTNPVPNSTLMSLASGNSDMLPDLFYYNTGLDAGKFLFDNQLVPQTIPKKHVKISFDDNSTLANAQITTYDGTKYIFIGGETSVAPDIFASLPYKSTWYLSKIISADNVDTIKFNYTTIASYTESVINGGFFYFFYDHPPGAEDHWAQYEVDQLFGGKAVEVSGTKYLTSIQSNKQKVEFDFGPRNDDPDLKKIDNIIVYYKDPVTLQFVEEKRFHLSYTYFESTSNQQNSRLRLDGIQEVKSTDVTMPPYQFFYSDKRLPSSQSKAQDPWGYFNGEVSNNSLIPATTFRGVDISTSDRQIHPEFVDGCILKKIISPLGGVKEYVFQPNRYGSNNAYGPGLRVEKIISTDPYSNIEAVTNYEYLDPSVGTSSGKLLENPSFTPTHLPVEDIIVHQEPGGSDDTVNYNVMLIPIHANGVGAFGSTPVVYEYVTVYHGDDHNVSGKTTFRFSLANAVSSAYPHFTKPDNTWKLGRTNEVREFKVESSVATPVRVTENNYVDHSTYTTVKGLNAAWTKLYIIQTPQVSSVVFEDFIQESKFPYIEETTVYNYEQNSGTINSSVTQKFFYERTDGIYLPTRITTSTSENLIELQKEFKYPVDYPAIGAIGEMQNLNMISYPVATISSITQGSQKYITDYQRTEYNDWSQASMPGLKRIYPKEIYRGKFSDKVSESTFLLNMSAYSHKSGSINYYNEDGHPVESQQDGDISSAIIVDRIHSAPVATIRNASFTKVAYSSFETADHGGWSVEAGSQSATGYRSLSYNGQVTTVPIETSQTITYNYSITRTQGEPVELIFSLGSQEILRGLTLPSGSGTVTLTPGTWNVSLGFDTNVSSVDVDFSYAYTQHLSPTILSNDSKTGTNLLYLTSTNTISKTNLPTGNYYLSFYEKEGTVNVGLTGASLVSTATQPVTPDGFRHVTKLIQITSETNGIIITGSNVKIDELRLYPEGALMTTVCYDRVGRLQTETDVNLRSLFYEYDEWGRLKLIRDHDKNILQHREYKLANN